jgi:DNA repair photolyase
MISSFWHRPATIENNNFKFKSLSDWSYNIAVGCEHACTFCYVPAVSTTRGQVAIALKTNGVKDPDAEWGEYVFLRQWKEQTFLTSLKNAEARTDLSRDGNRAVMLCTTTDPYQVLRSPQRPEDTDPQAGLKRTVDLQKLRNTLVREALALTLDRSTLNVRILTRSPLARQDFALMKEFGNRLLFGMSIPTLNNVLAKIYEPKAPAPSQRLATLQAAKAAGIPIFVAVAPTYPECDAGDLSNTITAIQKLDPVTIFMEPINIRAENAARIAARAAGQGVQLRTEVFASPQAWAAYAMGQIKTFRDVCRDHLIPHNVMHLWPDKSLLARFPGERALLEAAWNKISQWPR